MLLLDHPTRLMLFTGKGGVGKTSLACATAVALADRGLRVLLVSTDPASNLGQVLGLPISDREPTAIPAVRGLFALNIDPEAAAQAYRDRIVGPVAGVLPDDVVAGMHEQLSGACTTEIAAFDEFTAWLTADEGHATFDHVVFDTAPTGHTLRLLQLPTAWTNFLEANKHGASCLGPLAGLEKQRERYAQAVRSLANADQTTVVLVARPQQGSFREAQRTQQELLALGIANHWLIVNGVMPDTPGDDPLAAALRYREQQALAEMPTSLAALPRDQIALEPRNLVGVTALRELLLQGSNDREAIEPTRTSNVSLTPLAQWIDAIEQDGHGLIMLLGKGGVGKTTLAAAVAVELAARGHQVHLTTTDPAAHLAITVDADVPGLELSRIDPHVETERYRQHVLKTRGQELDAAGRALLEEDLRSPCTEEIAVFQAFSRIMQQARRKFVVVDTAPTGHTLLLLDATGAYHRDVVRHASPGLHVVTPMMRLQDPKQTRMFIVTLPETTPVLEAEALQADLRRAGIEPWGWIVNSALAAAGPSDALLAARAAEEQAHIARVQQAVERVAVVAWSAEEPVGGERLRALLHIRQAEQTIESSSLAATEP